MATNFRAALQVEHLECRATPTIAVVNDFPLFGDTSVNVTLAGGSDLDITQLGGNVVQVAETVPANTVNVPALGRLFVNVTAAAAVDVDVAINAVRASSLTLTTNNQPFDIAVQSNGATAAVQGVLRFNTGNAKDTITLTTPSPLSLLGGLRVENSNGLDVVDASTLASPLTVQGNVVANRVGKFLLANQSGVATVSGSVSVDASKLFDLTAITKYAIGTDVTIQQNLTVLGGISDLDQVRLEGNVFGNTVVSLGNGDNQFVLSNQADLLGNLTYVGGNQDDNLGLMQGSQILGNVNLTTFNGLNVVVLSGTVVGNSLKYTGGNGVDLVTFSATANASPTAVNLALAGSDDQLTINSNQFGSFTCDFGFGTDKLTIGMGVVFGTPTKFTNLP